MKSQEYAEEKEIERMNALELDRDMKIAEQKRFEQSLGGLSRIKHFVSQNQEVFDDMQIYKQGNLEY